MSANRQMNFTTTTGTGSLALSGTGDGWRDIALGASLFTQFTYMVDHASADAWEIGIGYLNGTDLVRHSVLRSSNANALVNFGAGQKRVFVVQDGTDAVPDRWLSVQNTTDATITTSVTATRPAIYRNLTISGAGSLRVDGHLIVTGTLDLTGAGAGAITANGSNGGNGVVGSSGGTGGTAGSNSGRWDGQAGAAGGTGSLTTGANGSARSAVPA
jgi:hypothetical protein